MLLNLRLKGLLRTCIESNKEEEDEHPRRVPVWNLGSRLTEATGCVILRLRHFEPSLDALSLRSDVVSAIKILSVGSVGELMHRRPRTLTP